MIADIVCLDSSRFHGVWSEVGPCNGFFFFFARLLHKPSGRTYHTEFNPPKVSMTDDVSIGRLEFLSNK